MNVTSTSRLVVEVNLWDAYDSGASPVNSGLLRTGERDYGIVQANTPGEFYDQTVFPFSTRVPLSDPDLFLEFEFKSDFGAVPPNPAFRPIADGFPGGPNVGTSENEVYTDEDANGQFSFSPPNAGDRRVIYDPSLCGPENCQSNWHLHIRGASNPDVIDPGMDLHRTPGGGTFLETPFLFAGFFDFDDQGNFCVPPGAGSSDEHTGRIPLAGAPVSTNPPGALGSTDTILVRKAGADLRTATSATVPIEILAFSLEGTFLVTYDGGQSSAEWRVNTCLSEFPQETGSLTMTRGACPLEGGTYASTFSVLPRLIFTQVAPPPEPPCTGVINFDYGINGQPPIVFAPGQGHWLPDAPPSLGLIEERVPGDGIDANCDGSMDPNRLPATSGFHPGARIPRCPADSSCDPREPIVRLTLEQGQGAARGFLPAQAPAPDGDSDLVPDPADNCPALPNPLQEDADDDARGDLCDICPSACDPDQADLDGDGFGDACDCDPADPANLVPPEVLGLTYPEPPPNKETLGWVAEPRATLYEVVRGELSALPVGPGGSDEVCLGPVAGTSLGDAAAPAAGTGFFYLVRGENLCGPAPDYGVWGSGASPTNPRVTSTCP